MNKGEIPVGFAMALSQNPDAILKFAMMSEAKKHAIIEGTHSVKSRDEMHRYVERIATDFQA